MALPNSLAYYYFPDAYDSLVDEFTGTIKYISAGSGSNSNTGNSVGAAYLTIDYALAQNTSATPTMFVVLEGTYSMTSVSVDSFTGAALRDGGNQRVFVCCPGRTIIQWTANSGARDAPMIIFSNVLSKIYGAILKRNNNSRTTNYEVAYWRFVKGRLFNCVFQETNANGSWSYRYDNDGFTDLEIRNCTFYNTATPQSNYSTGGTILTVDTVFTTTVTTAGTETNVLKSQTVNATTYATTGVTTAGVYSGTYAWNGVRTVVSLLTSPTAVRRGNSFTVSLSADPTSSSIPYTITGVTSADINGAALSGNFNMVDGEGTVTIQTTNLGLDKTLVITADGVTTSVSIADYIESIECLIVAGGGSGGNRATTNANGGGGAGGLLYGSSVTLTGNGPYTVIVGGGGTAVANAVNSNGNTGSNSTFADVYIAAGGGGGSSSGISASVNKNGGSGGGASNLYVGGTATQTSIGTMTGYGNPGGSNAVNYTGAGGGGAGSPGRQGKIYAPAGDGGQGRSYSISGTSKYYAGGGGGGANSTERAGDGFHGGGRGAGTTSYYSSSVYTNEVNAITLGSGTPNAVVNTGGGGGGGSYWASNGGWATGSGAGGSGIVIIRYAGAAKATGGTITQVDGYTIHTFTTSGVFSPTVLPAPRLTASATSLSLNTSTVITLHTNDVNNGGTVAYTITGVTTADINGASLTGNFTQTGGQGTLTLTNTVINGPKNMVVTADDVSTTVTLTESISMRYLIVGGGGGGGTTMGGGGGAGGYLAANSIPIMAGTYPIIVGSGGVGAAPAQTTAGTVGTNSSAFGFIAIGGGGGSSNHTTDSAATDGGSGGGAAPNDLPGLGTQDQGNQGGQGAGNYYPSGGGGAGAPGTNTPGNGGIGLSNNILGTAYYWAGGGGGAGYSGISGNGGLGGGGGGAPNVSGGGLGGGSALVTGADSQVGTLGDQTNKRGGNGGANTGGGGGGGSHNLTTNNGGLGGSGIVVIRYAGVPRGTGGTLSTVDGDTVHSFTTSSQFTVYGMGINVDKTFAYWDETVTFTMVSTLANGTTIPYVIAGVSSSQISGQSLSGNFTIQDGIASLTVTLSSLNPASAATMTMTADNSTVSTVISYLTSLTASSIGASWGGTISFIASIFGLPNNTLIPYEITGTATSAQLNRSLSSTISSVNAPLKNTTYSVYFDGTGDYLTLPAGNFTTTGNVWTIECWFYLNVMPSAYAGIWSINGTSALRQGVYSGGYITVLSGGGGYGGHGLVANNQVVTIRRWHHVALVSTGSGIVQYFNGLQTTTSNSLSLTGGSATIGAWGNSSYLNGYISNFRVVDGTAVYNGNFTVPSSPLTVISGTNLLTCLEDTIRNTSNPFDSITVSGNSIVAAPTGSPISWSNYFDGTGDYLTVADNNALDGFDDFTVEGWLYLTTATAGVQSVITKGAAGVFQPYYFYITSSRVLTFSSSSAGSSHDISNATTLGTLVLNTWYHIAASRSGSSLRLFLNGSLITTITNSSTTVNNTRTVGIGGRGDGTELFNGYISNVRLVKGTGLYTEAFTPSNSPLTAIANTSLLTCQSNRFIDSSVNNFSLTIAGDVATQSFNPLAVNYSVYFNGTGDYLTVPSNSVFAFGTGDFTIESWIYPTAWTNTSGCIIDFRVSGGGASQIKSTLQLATGNLNYIVSSTTRITTTLASLNRWYHVALVRLSGSTKLYVNGIQVGSTYTDANDYGATAQDCVIGQVGDNRAFATGYYTGYISNLRVVKGTGVYATSFTPSIVVLTAIANTSLLTCQSNRFIDNSTNNFTITTNGNVAINEFSPPIGGIEGGRSGSGVLVIQTDAGQPLLTSVTGTVTISTISRNFTIRNPNLNLNRYFSSSVPLIEYIDTEVTDIHSAALEASVSTETTITSSILAEIENTGIGEIIAAPTFAYSSGEDVKVSPSATQTWYI
jgi:hypothetical protein